MILSNSRYAESKVVTVDKDGSTVQVIVPGQQQPFSFRYVSYQVAAGDRLDTIAFQFYADPTLWWRIADANPGIMYWDDVTLGTIIKVPVVR